MILMSWARFREYLCALILLTAGMSAVVALVLYYSNNLTAGNIVRRQGPLIETVVHKRHARPRPRTVKIGYYLFQETVGDDQVNATRTCEANAMSLLKFEDLVELDQFMTGLYNSDILRTYGLNSEILSLWTSLTYRLRKDDWFWESNEFLQLPDQLATLYSLSDNLHEKFLSLGDKRVSSDRRWCARLRIDFGKFGRAAGKIEDQVELVPVECSSKTEGTLESESSGHFFCETRTYTPLDDYQAALQALDYQRRRGSVGPYLP